MNAREQYRRPESVLILVYTRGGETLLLQRRKPLALWQSITGSLDPGETHAEAAARELVEETGFAADQRLTFTGTQREFEIDPRWHSSFPAGVTRNTEYEWRYLIDEATDIRIDQREHTAYCWLPVAEAIETVWSRTNRAALCQLLDEQGLCQDN